MPPRPEFEGQKPGGRVSKWDKMEEAPTQWVPPIPPPLYPPLHQAPKLLQQPRLPPPPFPPLHLGPSTPLGYGRSGGYSTHQGLIDLKNTQYQSHMVGAACRRGTSTPLPGAHAAAQKWHSSKGRQTVEEQPGRDPLSSEEEVDDSRPMDHHRRHARVASEGQTERCGIPRNEHQRSKCCLRTDHAAFCACTLCMAQEIPRGRSCPRHRLIQCSLLKGHGGFDECGECGDTPGVRRHDSPWIVAPAGSAALTTTPSDRKPFRMRGREDGVTPKGPCPKEQFLAGVFNNERTGKEPSVLERLFPDEPAVLMRGHPGGQGTSASHKDEPTLLGGVDVAPLRQQVKDCLTSLKNLTQDDQENFLVDFVPGVIQMHPEDIQGTFLQMVLKRLLLQLERRSLLDVPA